jgi:hypothetical protein
VRLSRPAGSTWQRRRPLSLLLCLLLAAFLPRPAAAAEPAASPVTSFAPSFFADSRPLTALDMVLRIPGFTLDSGGGGRGLAGTAGNVLIDGREPVSRSESVQAVLSAIPADQVARIDLIRGGSPGLDLQGRPIVVNVIRVRRSSQWASVTMIATAQDGRLQPFMTIDGGRSSPAGSATGSLSLNRSTGAEHRTRVTDFGPSGNVVDDDRLYNDYRADGVDATIRFERSGATRLAANASYSGSSSRADVTAIPLVQGPLQTGWSNISESGNRFAELGLELEAAELGDDGFEDAAWALVAEA